MDKRLTENEKKFLRIATDCNGRKYETYEPDNKDEELQTLRQRNAELEHNEKSNLLHYQI